MARVNSGSKCASLIGTTLVCYLLAGHACLKSQKVDQEFKIDIVPLDCLEREVNKARLPMLLGSLNQEFKIDTGPLIDFYQ